VATSRSLKFGIIGYPVMQSRSPDIHTEFFNATQICGSYSRFEITPPNLGAAVRGFIRDRFTGFNVTIPHKEQIIPFLDELSPTAARIGAVNTVVIQKGKTIGHNTDYLAYHNLLKELGHNKAVMFGAGGAARAIAFALYDHGYSVQIANRSFEAASALAAEINGTAVALNYHPTGSLVLINATSLGMSGYPPLSVDLSAIHPDSVVGDVVYHPNPTPLIHTAQKRGLRTISGLDMLYEQARLSFIIWTGVDPKASQLKAGSLLRYQPPEAP